MATSEGYVPDLSEFDGADYVAGISGSVAFWEGPDETYPWRYSQERHCTNCGEPIQDRTRGRLCRTCRNRCKGHKIQDKVQRLLYLAAERRRVYVLIHEWWEAERETV